MQRAYFVVEGPHDVEIIGRLLIRRGLRRVQMLDELEEYWHPLVPRTFPHGGDLNRRVPIPAFFSGDGYSAAVHAAGGVTRMGDAVAAAFLALEVKPDGLGIVVDADFRSPVADVWRDVARTLSTVDVGDGPGAVGQGSPRAGIFVLPDNEAAGTAEDLLLKCAEKAYPELLAGASSWIDSLNPDDEATFPSKRDREDLVKPAGKVKAKVGAIANVLRPGKAVQVSLHDNDWLRNEAALALPPVRALQAWVDAIIGPVAEPVVQPER